MAAFRFSNFNFARPRVLSGEVCTIRIVAHFSEQGLGGEYELFEMIHREKNVPLRDEIERNVKDNLGPAFYVRSLVYSRGSIEILVVIGTVYYVISRYKNFVESLDTLLSQLRRIVEHFFSRQAPMRIVVTGSWDPGPALASFEHPSPAPNLTTLLVFYLMIVNAVLLTVLIWLLVTKP